MTRTPDQAPGPHHEHDWWLLKLMHGEQRAREFRPDLAALFPHGWSPSADLQPEKPCREAVG
ncbi:hypothetical protein JL101_035385 (plasmid) [Skermanella rosea]|uniref:hypothetical protein n=1 Tax=Skermanella rosea TaxID=1817965 RepID=UPI00193499EA|nr:hypothetical protein [Skermanella rosea]UEM08082.1 hypothetical protein JL101_035385 [Skermanella rosea]